MTEVALELRDLGHWRVGAIEAGHGDPVVLLHGSGDNAFAWKAVLERLASDHHVLALDFPSTSATATTVPDERLAADQDLLDCVLASCAAPVHLVAHSYGALLALRFALRSSEALRSLCLTEPIAFGLLIEGERDVSNVHAELASTLADWQRGEVAAAAERIVDYWNGTGAWALLTSGQRDRILIQAPRFFAEVRCAHEDRTTLTDVRRLRLPTLIASGAGTTSDAIRICDHLAREIPGAQGVRFPGAGHSAMRTHPAEFASALRGLFSRWREAASKGQNDGRA